MTDPFGGLADLLGRWWFSYDEGDFEALASLLTEDVHFACRTDTGTVALVSGNNFRVDAPDHTYAEEGTYTVNVTLKHDALASVTTPNSSITIADAALTKNSFTPPVATCQLSCGSAAGAR